jgi:uncharacterized SAM-binding protein YcdF (DUF218 family)
MSLSILLALAILASVLALRKRRISSAAVFVLGGVLFFAVGCGPLPDELMRRLQAGSAAELLQAWQPRAAIIVLGAGVQRVPDAGAVEAPLEAYGRLLKGLELYLQCKHAGKACVLILSGGDPAGAGVSEAKVYGDALLKVGVDPSDLVLEGRSLTTWQNAQYCASWLDEHPQDQVVLVTSGFHLRRGALYFTRFGVHVLPVRADYLGGRVGVLPLAYNFLVMDLVLHEYLGLLRYQVYEVLGWNGAAKTAHAL